MAPKLDVLAYPLKLCIKLTKWFPVLFITVIVSWSYYAYVIQLNLFTIESYAQKALYLLFYHILLAMFLWSFWKTVFTEVGRAPKQFHLPSNHLEMYLSAETDDSRKEALETFIQQANLPVSTRTLTGDLRYCDKCAQVKPDRCHHCMVCGECVLKMDHHCPWVNNCVSFTNYKFFVLFLGYGLIYCLFIAATTIQYFIKFWTNQLSTGSGKFHILFLFFVSIMFAISLLSLFGYHMFLISRNRSTIESFRAPIFKISQQSWVQDKEGFSLGFKNNFIEIFGEEKSNWFLPLFTSVGDGVNYPMRSPVSQYNASPNCSAQVMSYGSTNNSLGDGVSYPQRTVDEDTDGLLGSRQLWAENELINGHVHHSSIDDELHEVITSSQTNPV